ncbi:MAG: hypothetical protein ACRDDY_15720 [Clostridium sp.]
MNNLCYNKLGLLGRVKVINKLLIIFYGQGKSEMFYGFRNKIHN